MCDTSTGSFSNTCYNSSCSMSGCKKNIQFGKLFPVTIHNQDGSKSCGTIEYDQQMGAEVYQRAKNQFIANAAQPLLSTYSTANKIVAANAETTQNIFFIFFVGFWILLILMALFIFGAMKYGQNNMGSWFIVIILLIIIIPLLLLWWISAIYNNTYNNTKNQLNTIIGQDGYFKRIYDACPSVECCDCSCNTTSYDSCTSYKSCHSSSNTCNKSCTPNNTSSCHLSFHSPSCSSTSGTSFSCSKSSYDTLTDSTKSNDTTYGTCTDDN